LPAHIMGGNKRQARVLASKRDKGLHQQAAMRKTH